MLIGLLHILVLTINVVVEEEVVAIVLVIDVESQNHAVNALNQVLALADAPFANNLTKSYI